MAVEIEPGTADTVWLVGDWTHERKVFGKEEGHSIFTVTQHASPLVGGVLGTALDGAAS